MIDRELTIRTVSTFLVDTNEIGAVVLIYTFLHSPVKVLLLLTQRSRKETLDH